MKKLTAIFIIVSMLILTSCRDEQDNIVNPNDGINTDSENEQENASEEENVPEEENINSDIINLSKTMNKAVMNNIVTELTVEQQKELHELLHIENWVEHEPEGRGASLNFIIRNDNEAEMVFIDGNGVILSDPDKDEKSYYIVPKEIVEQLKIFVVKVRDEGIKNGNEHLAKQIKEFNSLIIGEPEQLYEIKEEYIYPLSEEALKELHSMLKIEQWKVYEGSKSVYSDEDIPLTLHKYLYGFDMLLQIKQYDDLYIVRSRSYEGPTDQDYIFEISEDIYLNLINFKDKLGEGR
jgi:hypothetical protein